MPDVVTGEDNDVDDGNDDSQRPVQSSIPLVVTISKKCGTCLEFNCVAYADEIKIDSMSITGSETSEDQMPYDGPNFHDFDEKLKKGFHKYLEIRGIKASTTNFLHEYMINKDSREYMGWLSNLKQFIEA
ncbi:GLYCOPROTEIN FAMILY PROTEIN [Salix koriyanagi]|uniref:GLYCOPROTEIN FAMILY PROTEIN n=1 Tax=Salix koriyanagi TaxID=2511006 RepID=A0A9Q0WSH2_9ROSI|nr:GLYCOPROTEIN FAMILY PROTEIN [Salix koriyanagi]